ncbi:hypothetical protein quinque_009011 [Culex quinquefasciatus]
MEQWRGKIAVVTGSSSGIGAAIVVELAKSGLVVVGLARRVEKTEALKQHLTQNVRKNLHAVKCDVSKEADVLGAFEWVNSSLGGIDVMVNNAGVLRETRLIDANNSVPIREVVDTNILGLVWCTREAYQSMKRRGVSGHIININSIAGHHIPFVGDLMQSVNIYGPTKYAVTAITEVTRQELLRDDSKVKITSISPGAVDTEILDFAKFNIPVLKSEDVAKSVLYVLSSPTSCSGT